MLYYAGKNQLATVRNCLVANFRCCGLHSNGKEFHANIKT